MKNSTLFENVSLPSPPQDNGGGEMPSFAKVVEAIAPALFMVDRIVSPIWYVIGFVGNPISAHIWLSRRMRKNNSSAVYLGTLAIVHMILLFLHCIMELNYIWDIPTYNKPVWCELFNVLLMCPQYLSPLLVLAFTVERYIAVCHPFSKEKFCTVKRAIKVSTGLGFISISLASVQAYLWGMEPHRNICMFAITPDIARFEEFWTPITELLLFFVVPVCVLIFNVLVIREIKRLTTAGPCVPVTSAQTTSTGSPTSTVTLLSVSFYFICTLLPASIVYALQSVIKQGGGDIGLEEMKTDPSWNTYFTYLTIRKVVEEICLSNNACYVFIYYITGPHFRREVNNILGITKCKKIINKKKSPPSSGTKSEYTLVSSNGKTQMYDYASTQVS